MNKVMKTLKGYLKSKTFWLNVIGGAGMLVNHSQGLIPDEYAGIIMAILNIVNRKLTKKALEEK